MNCASVYEIYGNDFGKISQPEKKINVQETLKNNKELTKKKEEYNKKILDEEIKENNIGYDNINSTSQCKVNHINNRFQNSFPFIEYMNDNKEHMSNENNIHHLVKLVKELLLIIKIIMFILMLLFLIKILEKKN